MSVVRSEFIAENSPLINALSKSEVLLDTLSLIAGTRIVASISKDEEYLITKQERKGDTPGWHWGDYSFALICLLVCVVFDFSWLFAGSRMRQLFIHPTGSRRLNVIFAVLMVATVIGSFTLSWLSYRWKDN
ncbi:hypothetical protein [Pseudomonas sp. MWU15-20650]|uniref:HalD/BesD family halogenase n=1 Tax=Pseudomonas sp. MWU15-20650 TaxID=2933107 RepID=UPI00200EC3D1|nr:hypothetical protein [Pseudomonas sp. MWU15-20650]